MTYEASDQVKRTQKLLESLEQKQQERSRIVSEIKSREVMLESADRAIDQLRTQIDVELKKVDPALERRTAPIPVSK